MAHESEHDLTAERQRREVLTLWAFGAFLLLGLIALGIDALVNYA